MNRTEALDYLVSEVKEWSGKAYNLPSVDGYQLIDRIDNSPCYVSMDHHETISKEDWARHSMTLRNNMEHCANVAVTDQFKVKHITAPDVVNHPSHYTGSAIECIDAIQASMSPEAFKGFLKGNVLKYLWRYEKKNGVEDLKKAQRYQARLVKEMGE